MGGKQGNLITEKPIRPVSVIHDKKFWKSNFQN
jgi:hypothetical protein